jgi:hypothetical protein
MDIKVLSSLEAVKLIALNKQTGKFTVVVSSKSYIKQIEDLLGGKEFQVVFENGKWILKKNFEIEKIEFFTEDEIKKDGFLNNHKILYLNGMELEINRKSYAIFNFTLNNLEQNKKVRFNEALYGKSIGKYSYPGVLKKVNGMKLGRGCVLIPSNKKEMFENFLKKWNVCFECNEIS